MNKLCILLAALLIFALLTPALAEELPEFDTRFFVEYSMPAGLQVLISVSPNHVLPLSTQITDDMPSGSLCFDVPNSEVESLSFINVEFMNAVLKVVKETGDDGVTEFFLDPKKPGKSTVTVKYQVGKKAAKTLKATYTVKKWPNPLSSITLNGKSIKSMPPVSAPPRTRGAV